MYPTADKRELVGLSHSEIEDSLQEYGIDRKYAGRLAYWLYKRKLRHLAEMDNIAGEVSRLITENFASGISPPSKRTESSDGSVKYLFSYPGNRPAETVFLPDKKRSTVCVSTQCGCARACLHCRTGEMGLRGNLSAGEIVNQILAIPESDEVNRVVFMGMGEPLDNTDEVIKAVNILTSEWGLALGSANITVSTVGIIPGIRKLLEATRCNLTLSLVSPIPGEREAMVPTEKTYPAAEVISIMKSEPQANKRRFTIAYMMIEGVNDSDKHLEALTQLIAGSSVRVNLLKYHPHGNLPFIPSPFAKMHYFKSRLLASGISASIRKSRGEDISAACGMLTAREPENTG
jgi:23S rRNA (adenine2503-C2)-methyltransferase